MVSVWAQPAGLTPGTYAGTLHAVSPQTANGSVTVAITLVVDQDVQPEQLLVAPGSLSFVAEENGPATPPLNLNMTSSAGGALSFSVAASSPWIILSAPSGMTPSTITVSADPAGLPVGTLTGSITVTAGQSSNGSVLVPVTFVVDEDENDDVPALLSVEPRTVSFEARRGDAIPLPQAVSVVNLGGGVLHFNARIEEGNWFALDAMTGVCPASVQLAPITTDLEPGAHHGVVMFEAPDQNPVRVEVWFTVTEEQQQNQPPGVPVPLSPASMQEISAMGVQLVVQNTIDPEGEPLIYLFELYLEGGQAPVLQVPVPGGPGTTVLAIPMKLQYDSAYWWRCQAIDPHNAKGAWSDSAHFRVAASDFGAGCDCSTSESTKSSALASLVFLFALALRLRRRRN
jgi:MYXO-CTERM domain-containing protein